jgi:hypothetical protein
VGEQISKGQQRQQLHWYYGESDLAFNPITCSVGGVGHKKIDKKV